MRALRLPEGGRLIASVHGYLTWTYASDPSAEYTAAVRDSVNGTLRSIYRRFVSKGIPVMITEFGAVTKEDNTGRERYAADYIAEAASYGIACVWWDNGIATLPGDSFSLLERDSLEWRYPGVVKALADASLRNVSDLNVRDPFILVHEGIYYMYGTGLAAGPGYGCYTSTNLHNWEGPRQVWSPPEGHPAEGDFWAPEVHEYQGQFYLFAAYNNGEHRGSSIFRSDSPLGPFEEITPGFFTPPGSFCIDSTLYVDRQGQPWACWSDERHRIEGERHISALVYAKLKPVLTGLASEPEVLLWPDVTPHNPNNRLIEAPFFHRGEDGTLFMVYSAYSRGYNVCVARSESGEIHGPWEAHRLLYESTNPFPEDGGHGMLFTGLDGQLRMCLHAPNNWGDFGKERARFFPVADKGSMLYTVGAHPFHGVDLFRGVSAADWMDAGLQGESRFRRFSYRAMYRLLWLPVKAAQLFGK